MPKVAWRMSIRKNYSYGFVDPTLGYGRKVLEQ